MLRWPDTLGTCSLALSGAHALISVGCLESGSYQSPCGALLGLLRAPPPGQHKTEIESSEETILLDVNPG